MEEIGWIEHDGGDFPALPGTIMDIKFRNGEVYRHQGATEVLRWNHFDDESDIVAYRIVFTSLKSPVREKTVKEILPDVYGRLVVSLRESGEIGLQFTDRTRNTRTAMHEFNVTELRQLATTITQIADALSEEEEVK